MPENNTLLYGKETTVYDIRFVPEHSAIYVGGWHKGEELDPVAVDLIEFLDTLGITRLRIAAANYKREQIKGEKWKHKSTEPG